MSDPRLRNSNRARYASDPARIARAQRELEGRVSDLEEESRSRFDEIPLHRQCLHGIRLEVEQFTIEDYTAARVAEVLPDYNLASLEQADPVTQALILRDAEPWSSIGAIQGVVHEAIIDALSVMFSPTSRIEPVTTVQFGSGTPDIEEGQATLGDPMDVSCSINWRFRRGDGHPVLQFVSEFQDEAVQDEITEAQFITRSGYSVATVELESPMPHLGRALLGELQINIYPDDSIPPSDTPDGVAVGQTTDLATPIYGFQIGVPTELDPFPPSLVGVGTGSIDDFHQTLDEEIGEMPIVNYYATEGDLFMVGFVDGTRANGNTLSEWGVKDEVLATHPTLGVDTEYMTLAPMEPVVEKTVLETTTLEAQIMHEFPVTDPRHWPI